jgi:hypothetical protein
MSYHPDDVVIVFTKDDVRTVLSEDSPLSLEDACKLIARKFDSAQVFDQFQTLIEQAEKGEPE